MSYATIEAGYRGGLVCAHPSGGYFHAYITNDENFERRYYTSSVPNPSVFMKTWWARTEKFVFNMIQRVSSLEETNMWVTRLDDIVFQQCMSYNRNIIKSLRSKIIIPPHLSSLTRKYFSSSIFSDPKCVSYLTSQEILDTFSGLKSLMKICFYHVATSYIYDVLFLSRQKKRYDKASWNLTNHILWCMTPIEYHLAAIDKYVYEITWFLDGVIYVSIPEEIEI